MEGEPPGWESDDAVAEENADLEMDRELEDVSARVVAVSETISELLDRLEREIAQTGHTGWATYLAFCREAMNVDSRKLISALNPDFLRKVEVLEELAGRLDLGPDAELDTEYAEAMRALWRRYVHRVA
jgi:hypothetical protein